ncbi:hypothetical protein PTTG_26017, partial [Puccinia triticina 1-1 BBBD Race 1]
MLLLQILVIACAVIGPSSSLPMHPEPAQAAAHSGSLHQNTGGPMHPDEFRINIDDPAGAPAATQESHRPEPHDLGHSPASINNQDGRRGGHQSHLDSQIAQILHRKRLTNRRLHRAALFPAWITFSCYMYMTTFGPHACTEAARKSANIILVEDVLLALIASLLVYLSSALFSSYA